jgi:hypothetical protein
MRSRMWSLFPTGTVEDESPDPESGWDVLKQLILVLLMLGILVLTIWCAK